MDLEDQLQQQRERAWSKQDSVERGVRASAIAAVDKSGPFCNLELRALQSRLGEVHAAGGSLVAISPETPDLSLSTVEKNSLDFAGLSDHNNTVARAFRLVHRIDPSIVAYQKRNGHDIAAYNGVEAAEMPLPATYVIDKSGIVRFAFVSADFTRRADPDDVVEAIQQVAGRASR